MLTGFFRKKRGVDLHGLSRYAACAAALWYLRELAVSDAAARSSQGSTMPYIVTGRGAHSGRGMGTPVSALISLATMALKIKVKVYT